MGFHENPSHISSVSGGLRHTQNALFPGTRVFVLAQLSQDVIVVLTISKFRPLDCQYSGIKTGFSLDFYSEGQFID
jgi:hypothetical protein